METQNLPSPNQQTLSARASSGNSLEQKKKALAQDIQKFRNDKIKKLRIINHWWNIILTVSGITFTLLVTVLGVVESEDETVNKWISQ